MQENKVPLPHRAACKELVSLVQKAFRDNRHLVLYDVKQNISSLCKHQRSSDCSTSDFASPSPEPKDMEVKFPASSLWDPSEAVLEAFPQILLDWPLGHKASIFPKPVFPTHGGVSLEGPSRSEQLKILFWLTVPAAAPIPLFSSLASCAWRGLHPDMLQRPEICSSALRHHTFLLPAM